MNIEVAKDDKGLAQNAFQEAELTTDPFFSAENIAELERRINSIADGTSVPKGHELIEEMDI